MLVRCDGTFVCKHRGGAGGCWGLLVIVSTAAIELRSSADMGHSSQRLFCFSQSIFSFNGIMPSENNSDIETLKPTKSVHSVPICTRPRLMDTTIIKMSLTITKIHKRL